MTTHLTQPEGEVFINIEPLKITVAEWLAKAPSKRYCAFCVHFEADPPAVNGHWSGYGECDVPWEAVNVPSSYRADNEGTHARYGFDCLFYEEGAGITDAKTLATRVRSDFAQWPAIDG